MPRANTPAAAVAQYLASINTILHCIEHGTLITSRERVYAVGEEYSLVLNNADPLKLRRTTRPPVYLSLGQTFEIVKGTEIPTGPFSVHTRSYWYQFALDNDVELLAFHWTPGIQDPRQRTFPHLHIGAVLFSPDAPILQGVLHKRHIPTGEISVEAIVRFAIEELGVSPLVSDWDNVLG